MSKLEEMKNNIEILTLEERLWLIKQAERMKELEREFELCDSTIHMIDMTINNPSTSDDDKFEKVNTIIKKYYADGCIHCNSKGFNGLDYCPNCIRGKVIQKNMELEQQNKRYREALEYISKIDQPDGGYVSRIDVVVKKARQALESDE